MRAAVVPGAIEIARDPLGLRGRSLLRQRHPNARRRLYPRHRNRNAWNPRNWNPWNRNWNPWPKPSSS